MKWLVTTAALVGIIGSMLPMGQASAATLGWSTKGVPSASKLRVNNLVLTDVLAISPNYASDSRVWVGIDTAGNGANSAADEVAYSTDGGVSFTAIDLDSTTAHPVVAIVPSPLYGVTGGDTTVFAATALAVYRSQDSGLTWGRLGAVQGTGNPGATLDIRAMAVAPNYNGIGEVAIGLVDNAAGVANFSGEGSVRVWGRNGSLDWTNPATAALPADITAIAYSPAFGGEGTLIAVGSAVAASGAAVIGTAVYHLSGFGAAWAGTLGTVLLDALMIDVGGADNADADGGPILTTSIAVPSNYNAADSSTRMVFVGTNSLDTSGAGSIEDDDGVFRVTSSATKQIADSAVATEAAIGRVAFSGTIASGTLLATSSLAALGNRIYRSVNATSATGVAYTTKRPIPGNTTDAAGSGAGIAMVDTNTAFALVNSAAAGVGGFSRTSNGGTTWAQLSLMKNIAAFTAGTAAIGGFGISPDYATSSHMVLAATDAAGTALDAILRSTNGGSSWELTEAPTSSQNSVAFSYSESFASDDTLFYAVIGTGIIKKSTNGGQSWTQRSAVACPGSTVSSMKVLDPQVLFVGCANGNFWKSINAAFTFVAATAASGTFTASSIASITVAPGSTTDLLIGSTGRIDRSADGGATFARLGSSGPGAGAVQSAYHPSYATNNMVYGSSPTAGNAVLRWTVGTSTAWKSLNVDSATALETTGALGFSADGSLYVVDRRAFVAGSAGGVWKAASPAASTVEFAQVGVGTGLTNLTASDTAVGAAVVDVTGGALVWITETTGVDGMKNYTDSIMSTEIPGSLSPVSGGVVGVSNGASPPKITTISMGWAAVTGAKTYQVQLSSSSSFSSSKTATLASVSTTSVLESAVGAVPTTGDASGARLAGTVYYWRVRANTPIIGAYTAAQSFTTALIAGATTGAATLIQPNAGTNGGVPSQSSSVAHQPLFIWTSVSGATNYELEVSTDGTFLDNGKKIVNKTGTSQLGNVLAYQETNATLEAGTVYFWRIRGVNVTTQGAWSVGAAFTTIASGATTLATTVLAPMEATGKLEIVSAYNYSTGAYLAYVPGLPGNPLTTISPNSVIFVTMTSDATVTVSGVSFSVKANTPTPLPVGSSVTISVNIV